MSSYDGIIFTGGAMRVNDMTDIIKKHINFASNCFNHDNKILAICWGLQVCSTAAGGKVAPGKNGAHIGIATDVKIHEEGKKNLIYKNKQVNLIPLLIILMKFVKFQMVQLYYPVTR